MKKSIKAALFSAFVFPGAGHVHLKKYPLGVSLIAIAAVMLSIFTYYLVQLSQHVLEQVLGQIERGELSLNIQSLSVRISELMTDFAAKQMAETNSLWISISPNVALNIFLIIWLMAIIDAYRLGENEEVDVKGGKL